MGESRFQRVCNRLSELEFPLEVTQENIEDITSLYADAYRLPELMPEIKIGMVIDLDELTIVLEHAKNNGCFDENWNQLKDRGF